jgi:transcriptional regulator with XRE-family HTH domain
MKTQTEVEIAIGKGIRTRRLAASMSQVELADRANVSVGALQNLERGRGASTKTLARALIALGAADWVDFLMPPPPPFNPLDLLAARSRAAKATAAPRVRRRSAVAK